MQMFQLIADETIELDVLLWVVHLHNPTYYLTLF